MQFDGKKYNDTMIVMQWNPKTFSVAFKVKTTHPKMQKDENPI